ncbi:hypothetical protein Glove_340g25 [Diversispora epigaea]|uniref:Uncharacterized protein n=1 Tax=Diversispora epigaea TaxID=1348612 RepID=A0A397HPJ8_9GLOM|nr:hypothetical protein Glove_340g25 [Diversispora epigaea]
MNAPSSPETSSRNLVTSETTSKNPSTTIIILVVVLIAFFIGIIAIFVALSVFHKHNKNKTRNAINNLENNNDNNNINNNDNNVIVIDVNNIEFIGSRNLNNNYSMNIPADNLPLNIIEENERGFLHTPTTEELENENIIKPNYDPIIKKKEKTSKNKQNVNIQLLENRDERIDEIEIEIDESSKNEKLRKENDEILETKLDIENNDEDDNDDLEYNNYLKKHGI